MTPINSAWHHIRRSPFQSLIAVFVMSISFLCLNLFLIISHGMSNFLNYFETKPEITIYLKDGLDKDTVESLQKEITNYPSIKEIKFVSKEKALQIYKEQNKDNPMLTEMVTASILPASFDVSVTDPKILEQIAQNFSAKKDQVDEIIYQKDVINQILMWTSFIRQAGITIVLTFSAISFSIIFVIIGMKITNRRDEIDISRLLGASNFYVKKPFLLEGVIYGLIGSLSGVIISLTLVFYSKSFINQFFSPVVFINNNPATYFNYTLISLLCGSFIGYIASWFGVKRYIRF